MYTWTIIDSFKIVIIIWNEEGSNTSYLSYFIIPHHYYKKIFPIAPRWENKGRGWLGPIYFHLKINAVIVTRWENKGRGWFGLRLFLLLFWIREENFNYLIVYCKKFSKAAVEFDNGNYDIKKNLWTLMKSVADYFSCKLVTLLKIVVYECMAGWFWYCFFTP